MNKDIIHLSALLSKALVLLMNARDDKVYDNKSLLVPQDQKKPLTPETIQWLLDKNNSTITQIEELVCKSEKYLFPELNCSVKELDEVSERKPSVNQQLAIEAIMSNEKLCNKVVEIVNKKGSSNEQ